MRWGLLVAVLVLALALAGVVQASSSTPTQLFAASIKAADAQHSVHYVAVVQTSAGGTRLVGDAAADRGRQQITFTKGSKVGHVTVIVAANTAYVRGDLFTLENYMGFPASSAKADAGKWLSLAHTAPDFATVAAGVRLSSTIAEIGKPKSLTETEATRVDHQAAVGLRGQVTVSGHQITQTLYVRASGARLPVEDVQSSGGVSQRTDFSRWNETVKVAVPKHAIAMR